MKQLALALVIFSTPAVACQRHGMIELDCPTRTPSKAEVNAHDRMRGAVDEGQWDRWNSNSKAIDASASQHRAAEAAERAQQSLDRANRAMETSARAAANESNARAGLMDRMYRPRPFQSGF